MDIYQEYLKRQKKSAQQSTDIYQEYLRRQQKQLVPTIQQRPGTTTGQMAKPQPTQEVQWPKERGLERPFMMTFGGGVGMEIPVPAMPAEALGEAAAKVLPYTQYGEVPLAHALRKIFYKGANPPQKFYTMDEFVMDDMGIKGLPGLALSMILGIGLDLTTYASLGLGAISEVGKLSRLQRLAQAGKIVVDPMAVGLTGGAALEPKIMTVGGKVTTEAGLKRFVEISKDVAQEFTKEGLLPKLRKDEVAQEALNRWNTEATRMGFLGTTAAYTTPTLTLGLPFTRAGKTFGGRRYIPTVPTEITPILRTPEPIVDWEKAGRQTNAERKLHEILGPTQAEQYIAELRTKNIDIEKSPILVPDVQKEITRNNTISKINTDFANKSYTPFDETDTDLQIVVNQLQDENVTQIFTPRIVSPELTVETLKPLQEISLLDETGNIAKHTVDSIDDAGNVTVRKLGEPLVTTETELLPFEEPFNIPTKTTLTPIEPTTRTLTKDEIKAEILKATRQQVIDDTLSKIIVGQTEGIPNVKSWQVLLKEAENLSKRDRIKFLRAELKKKDIDAGLKNTYQTELEQLGRMPPILTAESKARAIAGRDESLNKILTGQVKTQYHFTDDVQGLLTNEQRKLLAKDIDDKLNLALDAFKKRGTPTKPFTDTVTVSNNLDYNIERLNDDITITPVIKVKGGRNIRPSFTLKMTPELQSDIDSMFGGIEQYSERHKARGHEIEQAMANLFGITHPEQKEYLHAIKGLATNRFEGAAMSTEDLLNRIAPEMSKALQMAPEEAAKYQTQLFESVAKIVGEEIPKPKKKLVPTKTPKYMKAEPTGQVLEGLKAEARKAATFKDFEQDYIIQIKHGRYYHVTDDPNFTISKERGPRDMSSLANGREEPGKLMITSDLEYWLEEYPGRKYVAVIDMSAVPRDAYYQVQRGFGNEFYVNDPSNAKIEKVMTVQEALQDSERHSKSIPQSREALREFYDKAKVSPLVTTETPITTKRPEIITPSKMIVAPEEEIISYSGGPFRSITMRFVQQKDIEYAKSRWQSGLSPSDKIKLTTESRQGFSIISTFDLLETPYDKYVLENDISVIVPQAPLQHHLVALTDNLITVSGTNPDKHTIIFGKSNTLTAGRWHQGTRIIEVNLKAGLVDHAIIHETGHPYWFQNRRALPMQWKKAMEFDKELIKTRILETSPKIDKQHLEALANKENTPSLYARGNVRVEDFCESLALWHLGELPEKFQYRIQVLKELFGMPGIKDLEQYAK